MISIRPVLQELFDDTHVFNARGSWTRNRWLPAATGALDAITGGVLPLAGRVSFICARGSTTPRVRALFDRAGLSLASGIHTYQGREDYLTTLRDVGRNRRVVFQHAPDPLEVEGLQSWIDLGLLSFLNNKGNQGELVDSANLNERVMVEPRALSAFRERLPVVVKAATDESSGGGIDIQLCRTRVNLEEATRRFGSCERVLVEALLPIERSFCLNFLIPRNGPAELIGCGEQILDDDLKQQGSWVGDTEPSPAMVQACRTVLERAAARGYYGVCGIDCAEVDDRVVIFDLNFRFNASTAPALIVDALRRATGTAVTGRLWGITTKKPYDAMAAVLEDAIEQRWLMPYWIFDADAHPALMTDHRAAVVVLGTDRTEVETRHAALEAALEA